MHGAITAKGKQMPTEWNKAQNLWEPANEYLRKKNALLLKLEAYLQLTGSGDMCVLSFLHNDRYPSNATSL